MGAQLKHLIYFSSHTTIMPPAMLHYTCFTLLNGKDPSGLMLMKYFKIPLGSIKGKRCGLHIAFKWSILVLKQQYATLSYRFTILIALSNPILLLIDCSGCFENSVHVTAAICLLPHHPSPELLSVCLLPQCLIIPRTRSGKCKMRWGMPLHPQAGSVPPHCTHARGTSLGVKMCSSCGHSPISHRKKARAGLFWFFPYRKQRFQFISRNATGCVFPSQKVESMTSTNHSHWRKRPNLPSNESWS